MAENFFDEQSEQSQIKAAIVADYFWAWAKVMIGVQKKALHHAQRMAYIDLFAGPGRYENGAASTPLLVMERAVKDADIRDRLVTIFNDKDQQNVDSLEKEINAIPGIERLKYKPQIKRGEVGENIVKEFKKISLVPTFLFVGPLGIRACHCNSSMPS